MAESVADLESLYNVEATFEYTSRASLVRALRAFRDRAFLDEPLLEHIVLVTRFPLQILESEDHPVKVKGRPLYFPDSEILVFTMLGRPHELVTSEMIGLFGEKISKMNCLDEFAATGAAGAHLQNIYKEPDGSWGPLAVNYPTCVLEVGVSQSLRSLEHDAQRWIENRASHVTQVVTVNIYLQSREIIVTVWKKVGQKAVKDNDIYVEIRGDRPRVRDNRCLGLSFEKIFERRPTHGTAERDVIFSGRELGRIARRVWV
jgi:hypothetical protein